MRNENFLNEEFLDKDAIYSLIDELRIGIYVFDSDGKSIYANSHFLSMLQYKHEEIRLKHLSELFTHTDSLFITEESKIGTNRELSTTKDEVKGKRKNGSSIDLQILSRKQYEDSITMVKLLDITVQKHQEKQLSQTYKELVDFKYALDQSSAVSITDTKGEILYVNDKLCEISKFSRVELLGQNQRLFKSGYHPKETFEDLWSTITKGQIWKGELCNKAKDGSIWWGDSTIIPFLDNNGKPYQYIGIRADITERKKAETEIYELAYYDFLTKLPNKRLFEKQLEHQYEKANKTKGTFSLMFLDLHGLKYVNDSLGGKIGDLVLREAADCLKNFVNERGMLSRVDGNEFALLFPNISDEKQINKIAKKVLSMFEKPFSINGYELFLTVNIGISIFPYSALNMESLTKNTYSALQHSNSKGKNIYQLFLTSMNERSNRQLILKSDLRKAAKNNEFFIDYQPRIDTKTNHIIGAEALVRWRHPNLGVVSPGEFIPLAEDEGLIGSIGEMVLFNACQQNKQWQAAGLHPIVISVNFSVIQFMQSNIIQTVQQTLRDTGLEPKWLEIELTESALIKDGRTVSKKIEQLKEMGVNTAIDDFGTGYSSLSYLKDLKANTLKIDRSFINGIPSEHDSSLIVSSIIELAQRLNIKTVAEGVETIEQLRLLKKIKCDEIQGYLYSKPVAKNEFESLLMMEKCLPNLV